MKRLEPEELNKEVAKCQELGRCTEKMGDYLMRMHDIVICKAAFFRQTTVEEEEEAKSWSLQRWIQIGLFKIDLKQHPNPYSYLYRGSQLNMMNWILRERKRQAKNRIYQREYMRELEGEFAGMQNTDPTWNND